MITMFSQEEVMKDLIASERREAREEARQEIAQKLYGNGISLEVISRCIKESEETVRGWLDLPPQSEGKEPQENPQTGKDPQNH